jgi:hypothetical protein
MMHLVSLRFLTRVTERVLECVLLIALPDHKSSPQVFRAAQSLVLCVSSCDQLFVLKKVSVLPEFTSSNYPYCIFKVFLQTLHQFIGIYFVVLSTQRIFLLFPII